MSLRYIRFHPRATECEHCGAGLLKGAVELSDGRKYGRDCAARALGKKREDSAMKRQVEALRLEALRIERRDAYRALDATRSGWKWLAKGYGGNVGWPESHAYRLPDGRVILDVYADATARAVFNQHAEAAILGDDLRAGRMLLALTPEQASALEYGRSLRWTADRWAEWQFGKGWAE